jgi:hypothetical protein
MTFASFDVRALSVLGFLGLSLALCCDMAYSQTVEESAPVDEISAPEPNLEDQLIKSLLKIRELEGELRTAQEKIEALSTQSQTGNGVENSQQSKYQPRNGREEVCIQSVMLALRNDDTSIDWKLSCGEKLIDRILLSAGSQQTGTDFGQDKTAVSDPEGQNSGQNGSSAEPAQGSAGQQNPDVPVPTEPYTLLSGDDGKTPLMRQQREVARMKMELLPSTECNEAGKWLVDAAKDDLLLFSFFAVDRGQIGRCVQTNSGWRFERAGPFDEGYVLMASPKSSPQLVP